MTGKHSDVKSGSPEMMRHKCWIGAALQEEIQ
jgi:hypothetical protein